jgi:hypothetical protein
MRLQRSWSVWRRVPSTRTRGTARRSHSVEREATPCDDPNNTAGRVELPRPDLAVFRRKTRRRQRAAPPFSSNEHNLPRTSVLYRPIRASHGRGSKSPKKWAHCLSLAGLREAHRRCRRPHQGHAPPAHQPCPSSFRLAAMAASELGADFFNTRRWQGNRQSKPRPLTTDIPIA